MRFCARGLEVDTLANGSPWITCHAADLQDDEMLTLFSYPDLYGVADNNPYGLKVFAFLEAVQAAVPA